METMSFKHWWKLLSSGNKGYIVFYLLFFCFLTKFYIRAKRKRQMENGAMHQ